MSEFIAYSTFAVTMGLAVGRPRLGTRWRLGPGSAALSGVLILLGCGIVTGRDVAAAGVTLWRPFVSIVAIMAMTAAAARMGVLDRLAAMVFSHPALTIRHLFIWAFVLSACTASLLNNDAAVLLLTPVVVGLVRRRYPDHAHLALPFAFVVFMAAGVAPFVVSNPMNMIVASAAGLDFNAYAVRMVPIALAGWITGFLILRRLFGPMLAAGPASACLAERVRSTAAQRGMLAILLMVLGSYPVIATIDPAAIWMVSVAGAVAAVALASRQGAASLRELLTRGVAWEVLVFLLSVFIIAIGLRNAGLVRYLSALYQDAGILLVGTTAALGSALLNNHPMAILNLLALEIPRADQQHILAALIGGDLGPRLLPIGSLAGLLWLDSCRRLGVEIPIRQFVRVGFAVTLPTLAVSLLVLALTG